MDTDLDKAFHGVYTSSKEILKNKQKHLYCNMLDLLTSTCKTTARARGTSEFISKIETDDLVHFWLADILPLIFETDRAIQTSAIGAFEQGLLSLGGSGGSNSAPWHAAPCWPALRVAITTVHAPSIHKLRELQNPHWQRVWCLLVRCLDREILKGASTINAFLSIVELGFRSADNQVRAESFACWRLLIQIFHDNDELSSPKRMKLICIPLKSSQSKSAHAATVKLRVWWYLLTCLSKRQRLQQSFETIVEPFLSFCFGAAFSSAAAVARPVSSIAAAQQYPTVRELALPCLALLFSDEPPTSSFLQRLQRELDLEALSADAALLTPAILRQHWRSLTHAAIEAIRLLLGDAATSSSQPPPESVEQLLQLFLGPLLRAMLRLDLPPFSIYLCGELARLLPAYPRPVVYALNTIAAEGMLLTSMSDLDGASICKDVLGAFLQLFTSARASVPPAILQRCVEQVFALDRLQRWTALNAAFDLVLNTRDDEDYEAFETKLIVWRRVSQALADFLRYHSLDLRLKERASVVNRWLLWPLQLCVAFVLTGCGRRRATSSFDGGFCALWRQLLAAGQNSPDRQIFLAEVREALHELLVAHREDTHFPALYDAYAAAVLKHCGSTCDSSKDDSASSVATLHGFFTLLGENVAMSLQPKALEACLNTLRNVIADLKSPQVTALFEVLKETFGWVVRIATKSTHVETSFFEEWKRAILEKLRAHPNKSFAAQAKELFKGNDVFVIIPSVWSLNPDKLTDRQKERFAEKADIPALYNDMSQSQESSIKPWTPKKIVIAKDNQTEIVLEGAYSEQENQTTKDKQPEKSLNVMTELDTGYTAERSSVKNKKKPTSCKVGEETKKKENDDEDLMQKFTLHITADDSDATAIDSENTNTPVGSVAKRTRKSWMNNKLRSSTVKTNTDTEKNNTLLIERSPVKEKSISSPSIYQSTKITNINKAINDDTASNRDKSAQVIHAVKPLCEQDTQLNTQSEAVNVVDTSIYNFESENESELIEKPIEHCFTPSCQTNNIIDIKKPEMEDIPTLSTELSICTAVGPDLSHPKEVSPKKTVTKCMPLLSPPDRKLTNNSSSPTLRHKPSAHLTGRGAQLINMIRNKKIDTSIHCSPALAASSISKTFGIISKGERPESTTTACDMLDLIGNEHTSTPIQSKDLLIFSKRLPSPTASPSASILKRKMRCDSIDDLSVESPAFKRKRVSFHDPPVSVTKEYVRDLDENKTKPKRCLIPEKSSSVQGSEVRHILKRRSKLDSIIEIEKYSTEHSDKSVTESNIPLFKINSNSVDDRKSTTSATSDSRSDISGGNRNVEYKDPAAGIPSLDSIVEQYSFEEILNKYSPDVFPLKSANILAKFVSTCMLVNTKIKANVLETLSENHSKDFLDHAVQENLSSVVCDRLNPNSVIDYICAKSKINALCRNNLLLQIPELLKNSKQESEPINFLKNVLKTSSFNDDNILELITLLVQMRSTGNGQSVSESAVDSSSAL